MKREREKERRRKGGGAEDRQLGWLKEKKCSNACYMKNQEEPTNGDPRGVVGARREGETEFPPSRDNRARIFRLEGGIHL